MRIVRNVTVPSASAGTDEVSKSPKTALTMKVKPAEIAKNVALMIATSIASPRARVTNPALSDGSVRGGLRARRRAILSTARVEPVGDPPDLTAEVLDQPDALGGDRVADLGGIGDPLDQLLHLVAREQLVPDLVDQLRVDGVGERPLELRAGEHATDRALGRRALEHPDQRALDRLALERADDRLLGRHLDRVVDPGGFRDRSRTAGATAQEPRGERRPGSGGLCHARPM